MYEETDSGSEDQPEVPCSSGGSSNWERLAIEKKTYSVRGRIKYSIKRVGITYRMNKFVNCTTDEINEQLCQEALNQYRLQCQAESETQYMEMHEASAPFEQAFDFVTEDVDNTEQIEEPIAGCSSRKRKRSCRPDLSGSQGFINYFRMYKYRHPLMDECVAHKKSVTQYNNLLEKNKQKYRDMNLDMQCPTAKKMTNKKPDDANEDDEYSPKPKRRRS